MAGEAFPGVPGPGDMARLLGLAKGGDQEAFREWLRGATFAYMMNALGMTAAQSYDAIGRVPWDHVESRVVTVGAGAPEVPHG